MKQTAGVLTDFPQISVGLWLSVAWTLRRFVWPEQKGEDGLPALPLLLFGSLWRAARSHATPGLALLAPWTLTPPTWTAENDTLNPIWMPLQGVCWFLCCRQGFSLLGRDYGEKEEEESFELRNKEDLTPNGRVKKKKENLSTCTV